MPVLRIAMIGAGAIADYAVGSILNHPDALITAVHDTSAERAHALAAKIGKTSTAGVPTVHGTTAALVADANVDAVYIAVPNKFHAALAIEALNAGKHVLLDKPFALNLTEAKAVAAAAKTSGKLLMLGMNQRFNHDSQKIRALVEAGAFGDIYHAKACWLRRSGIPRLGTWFGNKELAGGGCTLDIGVHMLDLAMFITDRFDPVAVMGATYTKFGNRGLGEGGWGKSDRQGLPFDVDDFATGLIRFGNGMTMSLDVSWACHTDVGNRNDVTIFGTEAGAGAYPARLFKPSPEGHYQVIEGPTAPLKWEKGCRFYHFIDAALGRAEPGVTIAQALAVQAVLDGLYQSSATGREVAITL